MFLKNEYVFYGAGGICKIVDIQIAPLDNMPADREYYILQSLHESNGLIYIPVDSENVFLRQILTENEAEALLKELDEIEAIEESNAKLLRSRYIEAMRLYQPKSWVCVLKTIQKRTQACASRSQRLSETERSFGVNAKLYLCTELSLSLGKTKAEIEEMLAKIL